MAFIAVHHRQIASCAIVLISTEILAPHIHNPQLFRLYILIVFELLQDTGRAPCQSTLTAQEHLCEIVCKQVTNLTPQLRIMCVKHTLCADSVHVLVAVTQGQTTFIVVTHSGIVVVVKTKIPVYEVSSVWEYVLCTVINHGMALSKQIVEQGRILDKVVFKILLELSIICIHDPVLYPNPCVFSCLNLFLSTSLIDVTEFKAVVAIPSLLGEVATQEACLCIGVIVNLNDNFLVIVRVHTHGVTILL